MNNIVIQVCLNYTINISLTLANTSSSSISCPLATPHPSSLKDCHSPMLLQTLVTLCSGESGQMNVVLAPANVSGHLYVVPLSVGIVSAQHRPKYIPVIIILH